MLLKNAEVMTGDFTLQKADIAFENGVITAIGQNLTASGEVFDFAGLTALPGFVDIHTHGCAGFDACDATREALSKISAHLVSCGVTAFCPTTMTLSGAELESVLLNLKACMLDPPEGARILGINMEGPYIAQSRKGGQNAGFIRQPDWAQFKHFYDLCGGIVKLVDIAPECPGADEFIENAKNLCLVSIAHTDANYAQATAAFKKGVSHVTHLFNAMPGFNHREPGTVGAVFDSDTVTAELICDGFHLHPAVLRTAFRLLGGDRAVIVSDSMRAAGLSDGVYELGGQAVTVADGKARLPDGTIAGSTTNMLEEVQNLVVFGIPFNQAIKAATMNPARAVGEAARIGSLETGKRADIIVLNSALELQAVFIGGEKRF